MFAEVLFTAVRGNHLCEQVVDRDRRFGFADGNGRNTVCRNLPQNDVALRLFEIKFRFGWLVFRWSKRREESWGRWFSELITTAAHVLERVRRLTRHAQR